MALVRILIHGTCFPSAVQQLLLQSLRTRQVEHQFHYQSVKQAQQWIALHQQYAPSQTDPGCAGTYARAFEAACARLLGRPAVQLISLGCGAGEKESQLIDLLRPLEGSLTYIPCDVSVPLVLQASRDAAEKFDPAVCQPLVCDLLRAHDAREIFCQLARPEASRLWTFFGLLPNFEPADASALLQRMTAPGDLLLLSANLAPGADYRAGIARVLDGYQNDPTREWLSTFLWDAGFERGDGQVDFAIEEPPGRGGLCRINANFLLQRARTFQIGAEVFRFQPGEKIRLLFSYRHRAGDMGRWLAAAGLELLGQWIAPSEEEGVFLCERRESRSVFDCGAAAPLSLPR